jgi:hypothetical protein
MAALVVETRIAIHFVDGIIIRKQHENIVMTILVDDFINGKHSALVADVEHAKIRF